MNDNFKKVRDILLYERPNGFELEPPMKVRLLKPLCENAWDDYTTAELETNTFRRNDGVRFFPEQIAKDEIRQDIVSRVNSNIAEYGCFSLKRLWDDFTTSLRHLSDDIKNFELFLKYIASQEPLIFTTPFQCKGVRLVRSEGTKQPECLKNLASKIKGTIIHYVEEEGDCISEKDLLTLIDALDAELLTEIVRRFLPDILRNDSSDWITYQQRNVSSVPDGFENDLPNIIQELETIGVSVTEEALHTAISLRYGYNFRQSLQIEEKGDFRNLITKHFKGKPHEWKKSVFCLTES